MIKFTASLYADMIERLNEVARTSENNLKAAERSYETIQLTLLEVKKFVLQYQFKDKQEEILFFKVIKPKFLRELIYYMEVFYIEAGKPQGNKEAQAKYFKQVSQRINVFFERNHLLYIYYRMDKDHLDEVYFTREAVGNYLQPEYSLDIDHRFSTVQSLKLSKLQAYEVLNDYVQQSMHQLDHPELSSVTGDRKKHRSLWTDTKAALIELAYAIHSRGAVNNGKGDVKQVISDLELVFNVQLGNFYRTFQSMRIRKKNRTPFLDTLKDSLEKRMDDTDLNYL